MALFNDGPISGLEDLARLDSQLLDVASGEGIDVTQKLGLAHDGLRLELESAVSSLRWPDRPFWQAPEALLDQVVWTPVLKLWLEYFTLELVYSDAYCSQLNDRYKGKRDQFRQKAQWAREKLMQAGVGLTWNPVPRPGSPEVSIEAGGALQDGTYYVTVSWVNNAGDEGASAIPVRITSAASTLRIKPGMAPANVAGWNVFIGVSPDGLVQQNEFPIAVGGSWRQATSPRMSGRPAGDGQAASCFIQIPRVLQRG
jgi:hypothetical protein